MADCLVPGCSERPVVGEDWRDGGLAPARGYRQGLELQVTVKDLAVTLALCDDHGRELVELGWSPMLERLATWGWKPLAQP
jgi:hypothetical protein